MECLNSRLYQNLIVQIESQVEAWNREASQHPNPGQAHRLWYKAEGLQYAVRVLYAFKPEFDDLIEAAAKGGPIETQPRNLA